MAGKIRTNEDWYRQMFRNSRNPIIFFNKTGFMINECNAAFSHLLHYKPENLQGKFFSSLLSGPEEQRRFITQISQGAEITGFKTAFKTREGNEMRLELSWNAVDDSTIGCTAVTVNFPEIPENALRGDLINYRHLAESSPTSMLMVRNGKILYANPAFYALTGYSAEETWAKDFFSFIDPSDKNSFNTAQRWRSETPLPEQTEVKLVTKSGTRKVAMLFSTPVVTAGERATLVNLVDISERQWIEDKIQLDNERRRGIIITVAHELRTPLQPILGYLNLLVQDPEGYGIVDDTKKILERCLASVDRERQIINQMLELSVLESGKLHLNCTTFPLPDLISSVLDSGGCRAKAEISIDVPEDLVITADRDRLYGVFDSLFSNAINFSHPPRRISIFYRSFADDDFHHISIMDNGTGISENALSSIFEPFQLADAANLSRRFDRIGLSLAMAKKIVEMHGGNITVESIVHTGSTFTIHLPKFRQAESE
jgi:PAS domain S-box-containing protein